MTTKSDSSHKIIPHEPYQFQDRPEARPAQFPAIQSRRAVISASLISTGSCRRPRQAGRWLTSASSSAVPAPQSDSASSTAAVTAVAAALPRCADQLERVVAEWRWSAPLRQCRRGQASRRVTQRQAAGARRRDGAGGGGSVAQLPDGTGAEWCGAGVPTSRALGDRKTRCP